MAADAALIVLMMILKPKTWLAGLIQVIRRSGSIDDEFRAAFVRFKSPFKLHLFRKFDKGPNARLGGEFMQGHSRTSGRHARRSDNALRVCWPLDKQRARKRQAALRLNISSFSR